MNPNYTSKRKRNSLKKTTLLFIKVYSKLCVCVCVFSVFWPSSVFKKGREMRSKDKVFLLCPFFIFYFIFCLCVTSSQWWSVSYELPPILHPPHHPTPRPGQTTGKTSSGSEEWNLTTPALVEPTDLTICRHTRKLIPGWVRSCKCFSRIWTFRVCVFCFV